MRRAQFLKNLALLGMTPAIVAAIAEKKIDAKIVKEHIGKKIAIDLEAINHVGVVKGGTAITAKEILEMYHKTGVLIYRKTSTMAPGYHPVTVIDED